MRRTRFITAAILMAAVLCMSPGIATLATAGWSGVPSCCKPMTRCGSGLKAADCCVAERAPQGEAPPARTATETKTPQKAGDGSWTIAAWSPGLSADENDRAMASCADRPANGLAPPLYLSHSALLI